MGITPRTHTGRVWTGRAGTATEIIIDGGGTIDQQATLAMWLLDCPLQSPAWDHYLISIVHLRPIDGQTKPAVIRVPHASHELLIVALSVQPGETKPTADDPTSWRPLTPINLAEQFEVPSDALAVHLLEAAIAAVLAGTLWAEPPLSGQVEPWRSTIIRSSAHLRGEAHAS